MTETNQEKFTKPSFDGRLAYFKLVEDYLTDIRIASYSSKPKAWFETLSKFATFVTPFIRQSDSVELEKKIKKVNDMFVNMATFGSNNNKALVELKIAQSLRELNGDLFKYAKHILLPIKDESDDKFDMKAWMGGSDL